MSTCGRKCGHCGKDGGHNSRTCKKGCAGIKLFGVQIAVQSDGAAAESTIRKCKSLSNLQSCIPENAAAAEPSGYLSDGFVHQSSKSNDRKRGKPWSEDEHRSFLEGLEKLGKGDWKGIANNFVPSRTSTQVASHAQKYFNRLSANEKRRRRASVFDIPLTHLNQASNKADETSIPASSSKSIIFEPKEQSNKAVPAVTSCSERPPLSPMNKSGIPNYSPTMVYQPRLGSFTKGYATPTVSWVPVVNFSGQSSVFLPGFATSYPAAGSVVQTPNNDDLNLNIRKLTL